MTANVDKDAINRAVAYVRGVADSAQFVPAFKNYAIENNVVQGSDGTVTLNASIPCPFNAHVDATKFARALHACSDPDAPIDLSLTQGGNVRIAQKGLRVIVPAMPADTPFPWTAPEGERHNVPANLLDILRAVRPFIGEDATRPWALGAHIHKGHIYATNNSVLVTSRLPLPELMDIENVVLPRRGIDELLRVGITPKAILVSDTAVTFMHAKKWWIKAQRINAAWPDLATQLLEKHGKAAPLKEISATFRESFKRVGQFVAPNAPLFIVGNVLSTSRDLEAEGASIDTDKTKDCAFMAAALSMVLANATHIGLDAYPSPVPFRGALLRGIVASYSMERVGPAPTKPVPKVDDTPKTRTHVPPTKKKKAK